MFSTDKRTKMQMDSLKELWTRLRKVLGLPLNAPNEIYLHAWIEMYWLCCLTFRWSLLQLFHSKLLFLSSVPTAFYYYCVFRSIKCEYLLDASYENYSDIRNKCIMVIFILELNALRYLWVENTHKILFHKKEIK